MSENTKLSSKLPIFQIFFNKDFFLNSISLNDDGITPFESGLSTKSHSSTETFLDVLYIN